MRVLIVGAHNARDRERRSASRCGSGADGAPRGDAGRPRSSELRAGRGADLLLVDVAGATSPRLIGALGAERIFVPVVAYGVALTPAAAVAAIKAGAREFLPLPPEPELIAAILAAVGDDRRELVFEDPRMRELLAMARQIAPLGRQRADHRRERHRQGDARALRASPQPPGASGRSSRSTAPPSRRTCWNPSCSATRRAPSPARSRGGSASSRRRAAARCCSTRSARWTRACRPSCCARSRSARSTGSAAARPVKVDIRLIATSNRDLEAEVAAGALPRGPAVPPERGRLCTCRPCASGRPTSRRWRAFRRQATPRPTACRERPLSAAALARLRGHAVARQRPRAGELHPPRRAAGAAATRSGPRRSCCRASARPRAAAPRPTARRAGRPHRGRGRAPR